MDVRNHRHTAEIHAIVAYPEDAESGTPLATPGGAAVRSIPLPFCCGASATASSNPTLEAFSPMSARNGDKARFYRLRKKKFLRRELQIKTASSHKPGTSPAGSHEIKEEASTA